MAHRRGTSWENREMIHLAALIALATTAQAEAPSAPIQLQAAPDSPERRTALRKLVSCVAKARPNWARETLAQPYLSKAQAVSAAEVLAGRDNCIADPEIDMTFRTSTLVGTLAEIFVERQAASGATPALATSLNSVAPLNASEDFALCVAVRAPDAARALALSEPGSAAENQSAQQLAEKVPQCTQPGEDLKVDVQALRALTATALYRAMTRSS
jgi:uncharacterized protein YfiM (DUF2279 family)